MPRMSNVWRESLERFAVERAADSPLDGRVPLVPGHRLRGQLRGRYMTA